MNVGSLTVNTLRDSVLKEQFGMGAPDVEIEDGKGSGVVVSWFCIACILLFHSYLSQAPSSYLVRKEKPKVRNAS